MSTFHSVADGVPTTPSSAAPGTVIIKAASSGTSPASSPGTVLIRSSGTAPLTSTSPGVGSQNVVILRSPSAVAQTGPAPQGASSSGQGAIVIRSATTPPVTLTATQPNAQSRIVINPAPITQSRITITGGAPPVAQTAPLVETEVVRNEAQANQAPPPARRSSLTIKTAPSPTSPVAPPVNSPISIHPPDVAISDGPPYSNSTAAEHAPQGAAVVTEHRNPDLATPHPSTAAPVTTKEDLSEKIHHKKPAGPSLEELLEKFDLNKVFFTALAVLVTGVLCILTEGEVPLSWLLAGIAVISLGCFIALRL